MYIACYYWYDVLVSWYSWFYFVVLMVRLDGMYGSTLWRGFKEKAPVGYLGDDQHIYIYIYIYI